MGDEPDQGEETVKPDTDKVTGDPDAHRKSHKTYGKYLKKAGLPFEPDEFDESDRASDQDFDDEPSDATDDDSGSPSKPTDG